METTIEQQTTLDESLVPSSQRLRIGRCNFRLPSDIQSKEATLQVVYDVLRNSPLFRAFQVTAYGPDLDQSFRIMATTIKQQTMLDESLVPSSQSNAYQEYYACAMGEAAPKPKASARKKKGDSASSTTTPTPTPTTTAESASRLSASAKGEGTSSKPGIPDVPSDDSEEELSWKSSDDE
nr:hypothetical protein [Tanacetum cinerariifolium]